MEKLIKDSISKGIPYREYADLIQRYAQAGKTTGNEQTDEHKAFTKLNASRMRRLDKNVVLSNEVVIALLEIPKQTWLVISESWCGDAAQTLPVLNKIAEAAPWIDLKVVLRDENPELMDAFLTKGARAIPKLIIIDVANNYAVSQTWGARSKKATKLVEEYKKAFGQIDEQFKKDLQIWYNKDKGAAIIEDILEIISDVPFEKNRDCGKIKNSL